MFYIAYNTVQLILSYLVFPETSILSPEEIDAILETPRVAPVKMLLDIQNVKEMMSQATRGEPLPKVSHA